MALISILKESLSQKKHENLELRTYNLKFRTYFKSVRTHCTKRTKQGQDGDFKRKEP